MDRLKNCSHLPGKTAIIADIMYFKLKDGAHKIRNFPNAGRKCRHLLDKLYGNIKT
jgi:hypothetical protein